jgi:golgin subfamily B member 1
MIDALIQVGRIDEAAQTTQAALAAQKGRRSREAGALYHRLARIERHRGSSQGELAMLTAAMEMDGQNGVVASELGWAALHANSLELAQKALRIVTMTKSATTMPRAEAYAHLGDIAMRQGDPKRAVMLLKRAVTEDPQQERAHELLRQLGV